MPSPRRTHQKEILIRFLLLLFPFTFPVLQSKKSSFGDVQPVIDIDIDMITYRGGYKEESRLRRSRAKLPKRPREMFISFLAP